MTAGQTSTDRLLSEIEHTLQRDGVTDAALHAVLSGILDHLGCAAGTIHSLESSSGMLELRAQRGIPEAVLDRVQSIPVGKGMAGLAAERREPVQVCNLQTDQSGTVRPAAKETRMEGAISVPLLAGVSLRGVLGAAKPVAYQFNEAEVELLLRLGSLIAGHLRA